MAGYPLEMILEAQSYLCEACTLGLDRECRTQEEVIQHCSRGNEQDEESGLYGTGPRGTGKKTG